MPAITPSLRWPKELPPGLFIGRSYQTVDPMTRSSLTSGRSRQRRAYTSTPTMVPVSWLMTSPQAVYFETWFRWALKDGAEWLEMPLRMPDGLSDRTVRFTGIYDGPTEAGPNHWRFSAELEIRERQTLPDGWEIVPEYIFEADIIDRAANLEWPLDPYQTDMNIFDVATNEEWPQ